MNFRNLKIHIQGKMPNWPQLANLARDRAVKSSSFWFISVPVLVKVMEKVSGPFVFFNAEFSLPIDLPFSWICFFFAATSFMVANIIYQIWCPQFLKKYKNVIEFEREGLTRDKLLFIYADLILSEKMTKNGILQTDTLNHLRDFYENCCGTKNCCDTNKNQIDRIDKEFASDKPNIAVILSSITIKEDCFYDAFDRIKEMAQKLHLVAIMACTFFYALGLSLICWVILQNIVAVSKIALAK